MIAKLLRSKALVVLAIVLPGLWPAWPILRHDPTVMADPLKYVLHHLGFVACLLLVIVLTFTPLRVLFPQSELVRALNRHRTLVGVSAFFYAALHFTTHLVYEGGVAILASDVKKPFLISGMTTLAILLVRLAYVAAALAAYHQANSRKLFSIQVVWIFAPLAVLDLLRIVRQRMPGKSPAAPIVN